MVLVAVAERSTDPGLAAAAGAVRAAGYTNQQAVTRPLDCDVDPRRAFGLDPSKHYFRVALYFATRAQAQQFVVAFKTSVVGVTAVQTFCAD